MMQTESTDKHVVIVGGGLASRGYARELARRRGVRVTLLDRNNYHQFKPMLYQVATSQLAPAIVWIWTYFNRARGPQLLDRTDAARINWQQDVYADILPSFSTTTEVTP
jgi:2-polyprenyl-6-methoxyphenol hydroxylase-like FAD-dependent oxidoreductase